jgi:hypothetical protein
VLEEGEEAKEDVPLLGKIHLDEEIESALQPLPPQRQASSKRHLTSASTLAPTPSISAPA